jgi:protein gp37
MGNSDLTVIHWMLPGDESGPRARVDIEHVRKARDQYIANFVAFNFKRQAA